MQFTINSRLYAVQVSPRPLFHHGEPCKAKLDRAAAVIWLADQLKRHERRRELFHELRHVWIDATGKAASDEADADQAAEMMDLVLEQYQQQGGDNVLESLNPVVEPRARAMTTMDSERRCGVCDAPVAPGSIGDDAPVWDAAQSSWRLYRGILCPACDKVTTWWESSSADGAPGGTILAFPKPRILTGAEAGEWIAKHPEACRVSVAQ